ncbi:MAG: glycogen synthase GlgA, partial [Calditrichaeota bacterium]
MKNPQKICFISPEVSPFVKESPISEVANALPIALKELGHDVRVMMPNYKFVNERKYVLRDVIRLKDMAVQLGDREIKVSAKSAFLPDSKVQIYFLDNKAYFGREGLYADPKTGKPYPDNDERFAAFCLGCIQTLRMLHWQPDVIHCFNWPTGLMPLVLKLLGDEDNFFQKTKVAFTVSDFTAQGNFPAETLQKIGLAEKISASDPSVALDGHVSFLKAGLA